MTERRVEEAEEALALELMSFVEEGIGQILVREDESDFLAWVRAEAPRRFPGVFADLPNEQAARAVAFELGREIWNKVPLPGDGYRTRPIPRPERNAPCPCGSGQKHKRCCGAVSGGRFELPLEPEEAWAMVLSRRSEEEVEELVSEKRIPRTLLPRIAESLIEMEAAETALLLLESFLEQPERLDERDAPALEALILAYDDLDLHEAKEQAVEQLDGALSPPLRLALWESLAQSYLSLGDADRAQEAVDKVRDVDPENPVLGWVETLLLLDDNRLDEASERAREALQSHRRRPGLSDEALAFLEETAEDPKASRRRLLLDEFLPGVERLEKLVADAAARPVQPYEIQTEDGSLGSGLVTPEDLLAVEDAWAAATVGEEWEEPEEDEEDLDGDEEDAEDEDDEEDWEEDEEDGEDEEAEEEDWLEEAELFWQPEEADGWLSWLSWNPRAFDSLVVLADLSDRASLLAERDPELVETLVRPLVARGVAIVEASLAGAPQATLAKDLEENEAALDLLDAAALLSGKPRRIEER
jgi:tetratricopeptide (TPR) repeat protein